MSEQKNISMYQKQKASNPLIEDMIPEYLDGDMKQSALDFAMWLRENKIKPAWTLTNQWKAICIGKNLCRIGLSPWNPPGKNKKWVVTVYIEHIKSYEETIITEALQCFVWDNVYYCVNKPPESPPPEEFRQHAFVLPCNLWNCAPGKDITLCGKELTNICRNGNRQHLWFHDPDEASLNCIKRLLELEKQARIDKNNVNKQK